MSSDNFEDIFYALQGSRAFTGFSDQQLTELIPYANEIKLAADQYIMREGDFADTFYIIEKGHIAILKEKPELSTNIVIAELKEGDCIGEVSFIENNPHAVRTVSVKTLCPSVLIEFSAETLQNELGDSSVYYRIIHNLAKILILRLRQSNESKMLK